MPNLTAKHLPNIIRWDMFDELPRARKKYLSEWSVSYGCADIKRLHDEWIEIIKLFESYQFRKLKSLPSAVRKSADQRKVTTAFVTLIKLHAVLKSFSAAEDYQLAQELAAAAGLTPLGHVPVGTSVEWVQELLQLLDRMPEVRTRNKRGKGRPENTETKEITALLIYSWRKYLHRPPDRGADEGGILNFFDLMTVDIEVQYKAIWTPHQISERWRENRSPTLASSYRLSDALRQLRGSLDTALRP